MADQEVTVGVIGGSGLYDMDGLTDVHYIDVDTPFGKPSDSVVVGTLEDTRVAFLPRHGRGHRINPTAIPARANIYALKVLGVKRLVSVSAVGSLKEEFAPLDLVVPDQIIDRTRQRANTFFDEGIVAHIGFAEPFCALASDVIAEAGREVGVTTHYGATMIVMEGPAFSTRAESFMYRSWGAGIIGMTALPEAKLAREAEMCYATMAWITDYDCWHESEEDVTVEIVVQNLLQNVAHSKEMLNKVIPQLGAAEDCACNFALKDAIITDPRGISEETRHKLAPIVGSYLS
ncbi:MAG: S-methyl-5'-thioadenosine phosphorylase [Chloroflexi bacterium]|nr:S-methyl-5'-thioadenosine phosphorylase [Chloroflexota bacterium]